MAKHRKEVTTLRSLSKRQWLKITGVFVAIAVLIGGSITAFNIYRSRQNDTRPMTYSATSATPTEVSRSSSREDLRGAKGNLTYATVKINGKSRAVAGTRFTDVKSVLDQGDITLEPGDTVSPSLKTKVKESTVISINRSDSDVETSDSPIGFNTVRKETNALPKGQEKVQTEGKEGTMETTSLVQKVEGKTLSSNVLTSYVKTAPVDKMILVGTGSTSAPAADGNIGTTVPAGEMQQWAHDYLLANGYSEADFTATTYIISHESGWNVHAQNPSGAYGLPQALPGGKMASSGSDWHDNYQTQLKWFWGYCAQRYGSIQGAYQHWQANHNY